MPAHACWVCSPQLQRRAGGGGGQLSRVPAAFLPSISQVSELARARGRWCPCGWAWKPHCWLLPLVLSLPVFTVSCVQTLAQEVPDSCQKPQCQHGGSTIVDLGIPELPPTT